MYKMPIVLSGLIDTTCCQASVHVGNQLSLDFGNKIYFNKPPLKGLFHGEWTITTEMSSWRLVRDDIVICGDGDGVDEQTSLNELLGRVIVELSQTSLFDIRLLFDCGYEVHILAQSSAGYYASFFTPEDQVVTFGSDNEWLQGPVQALFKLGDMEEAIFKHSIDCAERWKRLVNKVKDNKCSACSYFVRLSRGFEFREFGLCSNGLSMYDGKIVGVDSGCNNFGTKLQI